MTDNEIIKALECCVYRSCNECIRQPIEYGRTERDCKTGLMKCALSLINRQKAEIERLRDEVSKARRKALLEASSKFAGHSDYHGDTILCKLICMAEGKEVGVAKPLDKSEIKAKAIKEFAERLKDMHKHNTTSVVSLVTVFDNINSLVKEMVGADNV